VVASLIAVADHTLNLGQRECPRYEVLLFEIEVDLAVLEAGGGIYVVSLIGVPVRLEEMSGVDHPGGDQPGLFS
jgi:hypothetical protein